MTAHNGGKAPATERRAAPQADMILAICNKLQANADLAAQDSLPCYAEAMDEAGFVLTEMFPVLHELDRLKAINAELLAALRHTLMAMDSLRGLTIGQASIANAAASVARAAIARATGDAT